MNRIKKNLRPELQSMLKMAHEAPAPRVFQYQRQRIAVRLEPCFIRTLEKIARDLSLRMGELIGMLAQHFTGQNFSSYVRSVCMMYMDLQMASGQNKLSLDHYLTFLEQAPTPALILNNAQTILYVNDAFHLWAGTDMASPALIDRKLGDAFELQIQQPLRVMLSRLVEKEQDFVEFPLLYKAHGNMLAARARASHYEQPDTHEDYYLVWLRTAAAQRPARIISVRAPAATPPADL